MISISVVLRNDLKSISTGINISEIGLSAGFSMPVRKAGSYIHLALEGGRRGTTKNDLIEERYFKMTVGFTINDRWFIKSKYD